MKMQAETPLEAVLVKKLFDDLAKEQGQNRTRLEDGLNAVKGENQKQLADLKSSLQGQLADYEEKKEENQRKVIELECTLKTVKEENQKKLADLESSLQRKLTDLEAKKEENQRKVIELECTLKTVKNENQKKLTKLKAKNQNCLANLKAENQKYLADLKTENQKELTELKSTISDIQAHLAQRPVTHTEQGIAIARNSTTWEDAGGSVREKTVPVTFQKPYVNKPYVHVGFTLIDEDRKSNTRVKVSVRNVTKTGFQIVFSSWDDSRAHLLEAHWLSTDCGVTPERVYST